MAMAGAASAIDVNQQNTLIENEQEIFDLMDMGNVIEGLFSRHVLTTRDIEEIKQQHTKKAKVKNFIARLSARGQKAFPSLIEVLRESETPKHMQLADLLENCLTSTVPVPEKVKNIRAKGDVEFTVFKVHTNTLNDHETRIKNLEDGTRARDEVEKFKQLLESKQAELEQVKAELGQVKDNANALEKKNDELKKRVKQLEMEVKKLSEGKAKAEEKVTDLTERMAAMERKNENLEKKQQKMTQDMKELKMMMMDKVDNKGRKSTTVSVLPPIGSRHRFEDRPVQTRGGARKHAEGAGARKPAEGAGARKPAEGGGARKPAEWGGRGAGATNPRR